MIKRLIAATFLAGMAAMAAGCNTVEGIGQDLKSLGSSVEGAANDNESSQNEQ